MFAGATAIAGGQSSSRLHFAQYLVRVGAVPNITQAFKRYLADKHVRGAEKVWPELNEVVRWINDAGGDAVLAHPAKY